jgi:hypothetical protein
MNEFYQSATYKIVQAMKATGNQPGVIEQWREMVEHWAGTHPGHDAAAILAWLPMWQVRPFYTPEELAPIFPALAVALRITPTLRPQKSPARLENELVFAGLPRLMKEGCSEPTRLFIVERIHFWKTHPVSMDQFERICRVPA